MSENEGVPKRAPASALDVYQELRGGTRGAQKALRRYVDASRAAALESRKFSDELQRVARAAEFGSPAAKYGIYFANTLRAVCSMSDQCMDRVSGPECEGALSVFTAFDFCAAEAAKKRRDASKDPVGSGAEAEFAEAVKGVQKKSETRLLRALLSVMRAENEYHERAVKIFGNLRKKMDALERQLDAEDSLDDVYKEGIVSNRSGDRVLLTLRHGQLTQLREREGGNREPSPKPPLDAMTSTLRVPALEPGEVSDDSAGQYRFEIQSPKLSKPVVLYAATEKDRQEWVTAFQSATVALINSLPVYHTPTGDSVVAPTPVQAPAAGIASAASTAAPTSAASPTGSGSASATSQGFGDEAAAGRVLPDSTLMSLREVPGNDVCADCNAPHPEWASINLGILVCLECSGVHRSLGTHISKVRSLTLDRWAPEVLLFLKSRGNAASNALYEGLVPADVVKLSPNSDRASREDYIRNKYARKLYIQRSKETREELSRQLFGVCGKRKAELLGELMRLLARGADPNWINPEEGHKTVVFKTLERGNLLFLEALLLNGASTAVMDCRGWTPLYYAAFFNRPRCLIRLMQCGAGKSGLPNAAMAAQFASPGSTLQLLDVAQINKSVECIQVIKGLPLGPDVELTFEIVDTWPNVHEDVFTVPRTTVLPPPSLCGTVGSPDVGGSPPASPLVARNADVPSSNPIPIPGGAAKQSPPSQQPQPMDTDTSASVKSSYGSSIGSYASPAMTRARDASSPQLVRSVTQPKPPQPLRQAFSPTSESVPSKAPQQPKQLPATPPSR